MFGMITALATGGASGAQAWHELLPDVALRIAAAALLGGVVALLYRSSRSADARNPSFAHTLVLLAPLIAMVTIAIGENVAAAFTLVGTLAIVRFRTAIRDSRDMAFVIFSVAVGMALGTFNLLVACCGVAIVGAVIFVLRWIEVSHPGEEAATLRLTISPPDADPSVYAATLARYADSSSIRRSAIDRKSATLEIRLGISGVMPDRSPALLSDLLQIPEIVRASYSPDETD